MLDEEWERAVEIGHRNQEIIDLLGKHCAHAIVERGRRIAWPASAVCARRMFLSTFAAKPRAQ